MHGTKSHTTEIYTVFDHEHMNHLTGYRISRLLPKLLDNSKGHQVTACLHQFDQISVRETSYADAVDLSTQGESFQEKIS